MGNAKRGELDQPWAFEAKEFLRKLVIGLKKKKKKKKKKKQWEIKNLF